MSEVTDKTRLATLLQVGYVTAQLLMIDDDTLADIAEHHDDDFDYLHLIQAVQLFKKTALDPTKKQPGGMFM